MRLLLDTQVLLWWLADDASLGSKARRAISDPQTEVLVSAASAWEIAIKKALGKLQAPDDLEDQIRKNDFTALPITIAHALRAGGLPPHHPDPFDRMIVGQALSEGLTVVTADKRLRLYQVPIVPA